MSGVLHGVIASLAGRVTDAFWKYVSLLLNTTNTNGQQNNTFLDSSTNAFTVTRNGDTTQGSFTPYMPSGYWSGYFDGTGDYLSVADNAALGLGTGDYTIEGWWYFSDTSNQAMVSKYTAFSGYVVQYNSPNLRMVLSNGTTDFVYTFAWTPVANTWYHVAITRAGGNGRAFVNGVQIGTTQTFITTQTNPTVALQIGSTQTVSELTRGYLSNFRLVVGTAVYTGAFTPPTAPLTAIINTSLLCLQDNRFKDNSTNAFAITVNGDTRISKLAPFNIPQAWDATTYGGSGYFDGTGDYLSVASATAINLSSGDFTVEAWVYWSGSNANSTIFDKDGTASVSYPSYDMSLNGSGYVVCYVGSGNGATSIQSITSTTLLPANTWTHLAFVKSGTTLTLYQNGVSVASATQTATITDGGKALLIGYQAGTGATYPFSGYISNARIVKGTAVYTANFTPPTAPLTAITNTSLLLNFTNAGIYDASTVNDAQTVGSAQVSTVQAKFGTTSMSFGGTTDRLVFASRPELAFGTGDFTIEGWIRRSDTNIRGIFQLCGTAGGLSGATNLGLSVGSDAGSVWRIYANNTGYNSTATWVINTWYHFALVKTAGSVKLYIDGTSVISQADTTNYTGQFLCVGGFYDTAYLMNGYLDEFRITNGVARYTANFTPPTAAFPTQ